jgi:MerR family transcriptional regulator, light-induced transcriptional regulator
MNSEDTPAFNLKAVVRETGLKPDTLRAWERRYGLPQPQRSEGGHRLYSQQDINILKWLTARQGEGMSISRAVSLWKQYLEEGRDPAETLSEFFPTSYPTTLTSDGLTLDRLRKEWLEAGMAFDEQRADQILTQAFAVFTPETVSLQVLLEGLAETGRRWFAGSLNVQQEHFISAMAVRRIENLLSAAPPPSRKGRILLACPPGEQHVIPLLVISFLLRRKSYDVVYLGANVPIAQLERTIREIHPRLIISSAQVLQTAATLLDMALLLRDLNVPLVFGGGAFLEREDILSRLPGHYAGGSIADSLGLIEQIHGSPPRTPESIDLSPNDKHLRKNFISATAAIEAEAVRTMTEAGFPMESISRTNGYLSATIRAALRLGKIQFAEFDILWIDSSVLLDNEPAGFLPRYIDHYRNAVEIMMDHRAQPIVDWLDSVLEKLK